MTKKKEKYNLFHNQEDLKPLANIELKPRRKKKMTRLEIINRAKSCVLLQMTRLLDTSNVAESIASFVSDFQNYSPERDIYCISEDIDSLISRLNTFKNILKEEQQAIINATDDDDDDK